MSKRTRSILLHLYSLAICSAGIYFLYRQSFIIAGALLVFGIMELSTARLNSFNGFAEVVDAIYVNWTWDNSCNRIIEISASIERLLQHKAVSDLFDRMRNKNKIKEGMQKEEWLALLLANYKQKSKSAEGIEKVRFNIKNNVLWKDGQVDFRDIVYHELLIPYDVNVEKPEPFWAPEISIGLKVRFFIVNGIIKLQIGEFSKELSPDVTGRSMTVYKTFETVTSFPLLYFSNQHSIPDRYLNLSAYATDSYWEHEKDWRTEKKKKTDSMKDWKKVVWDIADYKYLCSKADFYARRAKRVTKRFNEIREKWLKSEDFANLLHNHEEDDFGLDRDRAIYYSNQYLSVYVADQNQSKERWHRYLYPDYHEERP